MKIMGGMKNLADPTKVKVSTSSLVDGIPAEEMGYYADLITQASYSRAVGTREGGLTLVLLQAHLVKLNFSNCWNIFI